MFAHAFHIDIVNAQATLTGAHAGASSTKKVLLVQQDMVGLHNAITQAFSLPKETKLVVSSSDDEDLTRASA